MTCVRTGVCPLPSAAGHGREDEELRVAVHAGLQAVEMADVSPVQEDVDVGKKVALLVQDVALESRVDRDTEIFIFPPVAGG